MRKLETVVAAAIGALLAGAARGEAYTWVDAEGTVHFQEAPPASGRQRARKVKLPPASAPAPAPSPDPAPARSPGGARPEPAAAPRPKPPPQVELFTTSWCPWCKKARAFFEARGIAFVERDIEQDPDALDRKLRLDGDRRIPTAVIGGIVVKGYRPEAYEAALKGP